MTRSLALSLVTFLAFATSTLAETIDFSEPHPNIPPEVCPVCAKNRALIRDKLRPGFSGEVVVKDATDFRAIQRILVDINATDDVVVLLRRSSQPELGMSMVVA